MKCNTKLNNAKKSCKTSVPLSNTSTLKIRDLDPFGPININRLKPDFTSRNNQETDSPEKWKPPLNEFDSLTKTPQRLSSGSKPQLSLKNENFDSGFKEIDVEHDFEAIQRSGSCGSGYFASDSKPLLKRKKTVAVHDRTTAIGSNNAQRIFGDFGNSRSSEPVSLFDDPRVQALKNLHDAASYDSLPDDAKPMDCLEFADSKQTVFIPTIEDVFEGSGECVWTSVSKCSDSLMTTHEMELKEELRGLFNGCIPDEDDKVSVETLLTNLERKIGERLSSVVPAIKTQLLARGPTTDFDAFLATIYQLSETFHQGEEGSEPSTLPSSSTSLCHDFGHDLDQFRRSTLLPKSRPSDLTEVSLCNSSIRPPRTDDIANMSLKSPGNEATNICDYTYGTIETDFNDTPPNLNELESELFELKHLNARLLEDNQRITAIYSKAEADHAILQDECQALKKKLEACRVRLENIPALEEENLRLRSEINREKELYLDLETSYKQCQQENQSLAKMVERLRQEVARESEKLVMARQENDTRIAHYRHQIRKLEIKIADVNDQLASLITKKKQHEEVIRRSDDVIQRLQEENVNLRDELHQVQTSQQNQNICKSIAAEMTLGDVSVDTTNPPIDLLPEFDNTMPFNIRDEIICLDVSDRSLPFCENNTDVGGSSSHPDMLPTLQKSNPCHALVDKRDLAPEAIAPKILDLQHRIMLISHMKELQEIEERWNGYVRLVVCCNVFGQLKVSTPPGSPPLSPQSEGNHSPIWDCADRSLSEIFEVVCEQKSFQSLLGSVSDEEGEDALWFTDLRDDTDPCFQVTPSTEKHPDEHSRLETTGSRIEIAWPIFARGRAQMDSETAMQVCEIGKEISSKKELPRRLLSAVEEAPRSHRVLKSIFLSLLFFTFLLLVGSLSIIYMIMTHLLQACPLTCFHESLPLIPVIEISRAGTPPI